jgi:hypothetical protein
MYCQELQIVIKYRLNREVQNKQNQVQTNIEPAYSAK